MSATGAANLLSGGSVAQSGSWLLFLLSLFVVIVGVYPSSPVLILVMGGDPTTGFIVCSGITLLLLHAVMEKKVEGPYTKSLRWMTVAVAVILVLKIVVTYASVAVRELIVTALAWYAIGLSSDQLRCVIRNSAYILAGLLVVSLVAAIISYYLGIGDYAAWNVDYLHYLSPDNPLARRSREGLYVSFYMPYYLTVIPAYDAQEPIGFGLVFQRQNLIFSEWSYLSFFIAPLLFYLWGDKGMRARKSIAALFTVCFLLTFSVWGVVTVAGTLALMALGKVTKSPLTIVTLGVAGLAAAVAIFGISGLLELLGGNKLEQFYTYFGDKVDLSGLISAFGVGTDAYLIGRDDGLRYYGVLNIVFVYGIAGLVAYVLIGFFATYLATAVMRRMERLGSEIRFSAIAMMLVLVLGVKLTYLIPLFLFLFAALIVKSLDASRSGKEEAKHLVSA